MAEMPGAVQPHATTKETEIGVATASTNGINITEDATGFATMPAAMDAGDAPDATSEEDKVEEEEDEELEESDEEFKDEYTYYERQ